MELQHIKAQALFQIGSDSADLGDYQPHLTDYINEGYDRLMMAHCGLHVGGLKVAPLLHERSSPELPHWAHGALADWAAWCLFRNGSAQKQSRGYAFRAAFEETEKKLRAERDHSRTFRNIPK